MQEFLDREFNLEHEKVKYIPQAFFDKICNEIELKDGSGFDHELKSVIFSHVEPQQRLKTTSLEDLLHYKTNEIQYAIDNLKTDLHSINNRIVSLQQQLMPHYKQSLEKALLQRNLELTAHLANQPEEVAKPKDDSDAVSALEKLRNDRAHYVAQVDELQNELGNQELKIQAVTKLSTALQSVLLRVRSIEQSNKRELEMLGLSLNDLAIFTINQEILNRQLQLAEAKKTEINKSYAEQLQAIEYTDDEVNKIEIQLNSAAALYQSYLMNLDRWNAQKSSILGDENTPESINFYLQQLKALENSIPVELEDVYTDRWKILGIIFNYLLELRAIYEELYQPVQNFILNHQLVNKYHLSFNVTISIDHNFPNQFHQFIRKSARGSFSGKDEGLKRLQELIDLNNFDTFEGVTGFIKVLLENLDADKRTEDSKSVDILDQLARDVTLEKLYDFIFSLEYLRPSYELKLDGKGLMQLSPGERGILLLIFYCLIDKDDRPLIIDQPEENLDNQSVYDFLVPCIKEAKNRRQVIMVTHNPNLAVVCDADQIILATLNKANRYRVSYKSGSIENPQIKQHIIDVLEGTAPAFKKRELAYQRLLSN